MSVATNGHVTSMRTKNHVVDIEKLGNRRKTLLFNSSIGEEFLHRLQFCTEFLYQGREFESFLGAEYDLEECWQDIVTEELTKEETEQQSAIWEFIKTEKNYQNGLHIVIELFLALFNALKDEGDLFEVGVDELFGNIGDILEVNKIFWMDYIYPVLCRTRERGTHFIPSELLISKNSQLLNFKTMFSCYTEYCTSENSYLKYVQTLTESELISDTDLTKNLRQWLKWCENLHQCQSYKLIGLLNEPRTRLGKYPQLLKTILDKTGDQYDTDILKSVITDCKEFEESIVDLILQNTQEKRFQSCLERFEEETELEETEDEEIKCNCLSVISFLKASIKRLPNDKNRYLLNETNVKLLSGRKKEKVTIYIFSDVLLIGKLNTETQTIKIISKIYVLDRLNLLKSQNSKNVIVLLYLDEFGLLSDTFSVEVQPVKIDSWVSLVQRAKYCYNNALTGQESLIDFFKKGNSELQLFHYRKGKLRNRFDSGVRSAVVSEIIFEDDYMEIKNQVKRNLSTTSCKENFQLKEEIKNGKTEDSKNLIAANHPMRPHSLGCVNDLYDQQSKQSLSIVCVRQHDEEKQSTVIHYQTSNAKQFKSFNKGVNKYTQTGIVQ